VSTGTVSRRAANAARFEQVKTEKPDSLEQAVQAGLIELAPDHRDAAAHGDLQVRELGRRFLIEPTRDTDLVARAHKASLPTVGNAALRLAVSMLVRTAAAHVIRNEWLCESAAGPRQSSSSSRARSTASFRLLAVSFR